MKIVFFTVSYPTPWQPTAAAFNRTMVEGLSERHDVRVVAPVPWTEWVASPRRVRSCEGVLHPIYFFTPKLLRRHYGSFLWWSARRTLRAVVRDVQPDALMSYWAHPDGEVALRIAREAQCPCVVVVGGTDVLVLANEGGRGDAIRRVLQGADGLLTVGEGLRRRVIELGVPPQRVVAIHRGVDTRTFHPGETRAARERLSLPERARIVLWVGRMVPVKGLDVLLEAWRLFDPVATGSLLCFVGGGPRLAALRSRVAELGLGDTVLFAGPQAHARLADWYRAADLTVLPSLSEGVPNVLLESLACGTPFVASDVGGIREIGAGEPCELVPPSSVADLAAAIRSRLERRARAVLPPGFSIAESTAAVVRVLERTVRGQVPGMLA